MKSVIIYTYFASPSSDYNLNFFVNKELSYKNNIDYIQQSSLFVGDKCYFVGRSDPEKGLQSIINLAKDYGRYGYRRITALLKQQGWQVNHKRVERIWRAEGLKIPQKQPKRRRMIT